MKILPMAFLFFVASLVLAPSLFSQDFDYSKYKPRTLSELIELNPGPPNLESAKRVDYISGDWFFSQVRLRYFGTSRPISATRREVLRNWQKSFKMPDETVRLFEKEFLFKEGDKEFWLVVQQKVSSYFTKELKDGDWVTVYLFLAGGMRTTGKMDLVFLVNEFER